MTMNSEQSALGMSRQQPLVSVVMSVYNGYPYLEQAIESILEQSYPHFEFICIDDGSTDDTWQILRRYEQHDHRIVLLQNEQNLGYTRSLNRGIQVSRGEFIARQDADDISLPLRFEKQVAYLLEHPEVGLVGAIPEFIDDRGDLIPVGGYTLLTDYQSIHEKLLDVNCIRHGSVMIRRTCLDLVGIYDPELEPSEDYDLWLRLAEVSHLVNLSEPLYQYREHSNSVSYQRRFRQMYHKAIGLERALARRYGPSAPGEYRAFLARDYVRTAYLGATCGQVDQAQTAFSKAVAIDPALSVSGTMVEEVVKKYLVSQPGADPFDSIRVFFGQVMPDTKYLRGVKSRLISGLHQQKFASAILAGEKGQAVHSYLAGLRLDPGYFFQPAVIMKLVTCMVSRKE